MNSFSSLIFEGGFESHRLTGSTQELLGCARVVSKSKVSRQVQVYSLLEYNLTKMNKELSLVQKTNIPKN
ncbi:hypothetical protein BpHYR1_010219 [Brachionus plicatilis]|uniref:Uncharacterized protein n=1 Tax=Brachionus plicatilis TaxID=10195 RepID=A0A3M7PP85_BRAPC|nr:hypothetical protein BpHYR1_010219 [Brachionus plicatilis]